jgi:CheY-like chemotaxis protein
MDQLTARLGPDDPVLRGLADIEQSAQRASTLTRQLLAFSRRQVFRPTVLDLNRTLLDMEKMLRRVLPEQVELVTRLATQLRAIQGDPGQIEQVVLNLVVNARDAMPDGGQLVLATANVTLDEHYCSIHAEVRPGSYVTLAVTDTGLGMDTATAERVFEPFFTTKPMGKGTGLGLSMVYGIVKQAGGHVSVYSEAGVGSTFSVYWPAAETPLAEASAPRRVDGVATGTETVLVCEDDDAVRDLAVHMLRNAGYSVLSACNGREALRVANSVTEPMHLLLTDVIMPDLNGRQVYDQLKPTWPDLRALFISGYPSDVIAYHGVLDEGVEFLQKPFTRRHLLKRVRDVLDA